MGAQEVCDGADLAGHTCQSFGFYSGSLVCAAGCTDFDLSGCTGTCGDGAQNGAEVCDGNDLDGQTCVSIGFDAGGLACRLDCMAFDTSDCSYSCSVNCGGPGCDGEPCGADGWTCSSGVCACLGNGGAPETTESSCSDGHDNDCDGDADCADSNCIGDLCGANGMRCSGGLCLCPGGSVESNCSNGLDDDCDGQSDCDDPSCAGDPCGADGLICSAGACLCPGDSEGTAALCVDGIDNDCDGLTDAADVDCCGLHGLPPCAAGCNVGLQECDDGNCWSCCSDGMENGVCGTHGAIPCSPDPTHLYFDADCCGGHGQPACGTQGCDAGFQECGLGNCWYCCSDGTQNGTCGTWSDMTPCSPISTHPRYDADCP